VHHTRCFTLSALLLSFCLPALTQTTPKNDSSPGLQSKARVSLAELPLAFEPNVGQAPANQLYVTRSAAMQIGFSEGSVSLELPSDGDGLAISLVGSRHGAKPVPSQKEEGESNYLKGNDPALWQTHVPQYGRLIYSDIYPGVDLLFYGTGGRVEHDFVVQPGANYRQIQMRYDGAKHLSLSANGDLHVTMVVCPIFCTSEIH
jgi:hypothetical protein